MPVKRSIRIKKRPQPNKSIRAKRSTRTPFWRSTPAIFGAMICTFMAAILVGAYQSRDGLRVHKKVVADADTVIERSEAATTPTASPAVSAPMNELAETAASDAAAVDVPHNGQPARVTITGCLERSDEAFRLTDTTGMNAPTARSWKSAFLKKRPAPIDVVEGGKRLNFASHVGQRVSLTGTLEAHEMRAGSLRRVASSCSSTPKTRI